MSCYPDFAGRLQLAFTGGQIKRETDRRGDPGWRAARKADSGRRAFVVAGDAIVLKKSGALADPLFTLAEVDGFGVAQEKVWLGSDEGAGRFAIGLDRAVTDALKSRGLLVVDLRSIAIQGLVSAAHLPGPIFRRRRIDLRSALKLPAGAEIAAGASRYARGCAGIGAGELGDDPLDRPARRELHDNE